MLGPPSLAVVLSYLYLTILTARRHRAKKLLSLLAFLLAVPVVVLSVVTAVGSALCFALYLSSALPPEFYEPIFLPGHIAVGGALLVVGIAAFPLFRKKLFSGTFIIWNSILLLSMAGVLIADTILALSQGIPLGTITLAAAYAGFWLVVILLAYCSAIEGREALWARMRRTAIGSLLERAHIPITVVVCIGFYVFLGTIGVSEFREGYRLSSFIEMVSTPALLFLLLLLSRRVSWLRQLLFPEPYSPRSIRLTIILFGTGALITVSVYIGLWLYPFISNLHV